MISVVTDSCVGRHTVEIKGHALSGEQGHDLVCSASSVLLYTLTANLERLEDEGEIVGLSCDICPGRAYIEFDDAESEGESRGGIVLDAFMLGYELLAETFGECVEVRIG